MNQTSSSLRKNMIAIILLVLGGLFIAGQFFANMSTSIRSLSLMGTVKSPTSYNFPSFEKLLKAHVHEGRVDYAALKNSPDLPKALDDLEHVSPVKMGKIDALVFWINTYNLLNIQKVVRAYPVRNVDQIPRVLTEQKYVVGGEPYSITDIEHDMIRPLARDTEPAAIFLSCNGTMGYPQLPDHLITKASLPADIDRAVPQFVQNQHNYFIDRPKHRFFISQFYKWHQDIFSGRYGNTFTFANAHLPESIRLNEEEQPGFQYDYFPGFNWLINDLSTEPHTATTKEGNR